MHYAFPSHQDTEFHTIFRLYDHLKPSNAEPPTPRNLKIFINTLGALHHQWQERIPLTEQAAFVLLSDMPGEDILALLRGASSPQLLPSFANTLNAMLGDGWQRRLAALYFNVNPEDAYQTLLALPIKNAARAGDGKALKELEQNPGFPEVLEGVIEEVCGVTSGGDAEFLAHSATAFSEIKGNWPAHDACKAHLCRTALSVKIWQPFTAEVANGIKDLIRLLPSTCDVTPLIRSIRASKTQSKEWCIGLVSIFPTLAQHDEATVSREFFIPGSPEEYIAIISETRKVESPDVPWKYMRPEIPKNQIVESLASLVNANKWNVEFAGVVESLLQVATDWNWALLTSSLQSRIRSPHQSLDADLLAVAESSFRLVPVSGGTRDSLRESSQGDSFLQVLYLFKQAGQVDAAAICILPLLTNASQTNFNMNATFQPNTPPWRGQEGRRILLSLLQNPDSDPSLLQALRSKCLRWSSFGEWRDISQKMPDRKLVVVRLLSGLLQGSNGPQIDAGELIRNIVYWREIEGRDQLEQLLRLKAKSGELTKTLASETFSLERRHLYLLALREDDNETYRQFLIKSLLQRTQDEWQSAMSNESELLELALALKTDGLLLGQPFKDALGWHIEQQLSQKSSGRLAPTWCDLLGLLSSADLTVTHQRLLNKFKSSTGRAAGLIHYYGSALSGIVLEDGPEKSFDRITQIIEGRDEAEARWLGALLAGWGAFRKKIDPIRSDWENRTQKALEQEIPPELQSALQDLLKVLQGGPKARL